MTDWLQVRKQGRRERERGYGYGGGYGDGGKGRQRHKDTSVWMARSHPQEREWRSRASLPHPAPFLPSPPKPTYASPCALELGSRGATGPGRARSELPGSQHSQRPTPAAPSLPTPYNLVAQYYASEYRGSVPLIHPNYPIIQFITRYAVWRSASLIAPHTYRCGSPMNGEY